MVDIAEEKRKAMEIARRTVNKLGWRWKEPIGISTDGSTWIIKTNANAFGGHYKVYIDRRAFKVIKASTVCRNGLVILFDENGEPIQDNK